MKGALMVSFPSTHVAKQTNSLLSIEPHYGKPNNNNWNVFHFPLSEKLQIFSAFRLAASQRNVPTSPYSHLYYPVYTTVLYDTVESH